MEDQSRTDNRSQFQWLQCNKFYSTTGISGFSLIHHANRRLEMIFWYLVIAGFSAFTIYNVRILVDQYLHQEPVTTVTLREGHALVDPARLEFCLRIVMPEFHTELANLAHSFFPVFQYPQPYNVSLEEDVGKALDKLDSKETIYNESKNLSFGQRWDISIVNLLARHFSIMLTCQEYPTSCGPALSLTWIVSNYSNSVIVRQQIDRVLDHFRQLNVSDHELLDLFSIEIQRLFGFQYAAMTSSGAPEHWKAVQIRRIVEFNVFTIFCFKPQAVETSPDQIVNSAHLDRINQQLLDYGVLEDNATMDTAKKWTAERKPALMVFLSTESLSLTLSTDEGSFNPDAMAGYGSSAFYITRVSASYHSIQK